MTLTTHLTGPWFGNVTVILVLISPALTMRLLAEEYQRGTIELLLTSPVSSWEIVLGKFVGAVAFLGLMLAGTGYVPLTLFAYGSPDPGPLLAGYLALMLLGGATIAIGLFVSSMTQNPLVALVVGFCLALFVYLLPWIDSAPDSLPSLLGMSSHVRELLGGRLLLSDLVYFVGLCAVLLLAAQQRVEARRWS
jgi:ABC-2 type transport system permease protein